jgi:hypothetical protein
MEQKLYSQLVRTLLRIPGIEDQGYRTALLGIIPIRDLPRSSNPFTDISNIVLHLNALILNTGENALLIFLENAKSRLEGLSLYNELEELQRQTAAILRDRQGNDDADTAADQMALAVQSDLSSDETAAQLTIQPNAIALRDAMMLAYNLNELELLCGSLNMNIENLGGGPFNLKIQHLIEYFLRRGQYEELVKKVLADRPHLINILQEAEVSPKRQQDLPSLPPANHNGPVAEAPAKREKRTVSPKPPASLHNPPSRQPDMSTLSAQKHPTNRERILVHKSTIQAISNVLRTQSRFLTRYELERFRGELSEIAEYVNKLSFDEAFELFKSSEAFLEKMDEAILQLDVALAAWDHLQRNRFDGEVQLQYYRHLKNCRSQLEEAISYLEAWF